MPIYRTSKTEVQGIIDACIWGISEVSFTAYRGI
jgi:hypothetical protein